MRKFLTVQADRKPSTELSFLSPKEGSRILASLWKMIFARGFTISVLVFLLTEPQVIAGGSGCNETIYLNNTPSGSIYSPGYPYNYDNNENCLWLLVAPIGSKVLLYFTTFEVEDHSWCNYDSVELFNGPTSSSASLSKSCGGSLPSPVYSSSRYMVMQFKSDSLVTEKGFVAHYRELNNSSGCPQIVPGASAGVIYSPNFPWNYPNSISCNWAITPKYSWKKIKLSFMKFDLEDYSCDADYVEVNSGYGHQIGKYCGSQIPSPVFRSGPINVKFYSDYSIRSSGFMAFYETLESFTTPPPTYWSNPMTWTSPTYRSNPTYWPWSRHTYYTRYPATYSPPKASLYTCNRYYQTNIFVASSSSSSIASSSDIDGFYPTSRPSSCTFKIGTASGYILELSFTKMSISSCSGCSCGYVKVRDGTTSSSRLLGTFCNSKYRDVVTTGNHMFVEYYASYWNDNFKATVRSKKAGVNVPAIAVPIVAAVVLFTIILIVIKCTKIRRLSAVHGVPLQSSAPGAEQPPTAQSLYCNAGFGMNQQPSAPNAEFAVPPPYPQPLATASHPPLPSSTDYSQGNTNMALAVEMA